MVSPGIGAYWTLHMLERIVRINIRVELALGGRRVCDIGMSGSSSDVVSIIFCFQVLSFLDVFRVNTIKNKADYTSEEVGSRDLCQYSLAEIHIEKFSVDIHLHKDI